MNSFASGFYCGAIARSFNTKQRLQSLATNAGYGVAYDYDYVGRLNSLSEGFHLAKYGYKPNVGTVETVTIKRAGVERVRHQRTTDNLGRISQVKTTTGATIPVQRDYTYNDANQRTQIAHEDTRRWAYDYDSLGQVTSAQKRLADDITPLPGYTFGFTFDDIGNRATTTVNSRSATYAPNLLNQYESRTIPGAFDVRGEAHTTATVTVNTDPTTRTGKDFYRELSAANTSAPVNASIVINATEGSETVSDEVAGFLARTPESFAHDLDGNLTEDGRWSCGYDAEKRLISMETPTALALAFPALKKRVTFTYDSQSRRIRKHVETWDAALNGGLGGWTSTADMRFIYDDWNLLTELDALTSSAVVRSHVWGLDLSGAIQGAGGVGGLLWTNTPNHTFATSVDANGNIVAWVNTATLAVAGRADYGAFGEIVMQTGVAKELPFGFSTKYTDRESGLLYYGFRYLSTSTGSWLSRDPIEENGGLSLYCFGRNDALNGIDPLGNVWTNQFSGGSYNPPPTLAQALLGHYTGRSGTEVTLSYDEVVSLEIEPSLDIFLHKGVTDRLEKVISTNQAEVIVESDDAVRGHYTNSRAGNNALGSFTVRAKGSINCINETGGIAYVFKGEFRVEDRYDFENLWEGHRKFAGNIKTVLMSPVPGVAFEVRSEWISVEQTFGKGNSPIW